MFLLTAVLPRQSDQMTVGLQWFVKYISSLQDCNCIPELGFAWCIFMSRTYFFFFLPDLQPWDMLLERINQWMDGWNCVTQISPNDTFFLFLHLYFYLLFPSGFIPQSFIECLLWARFFWDILKKKKKAKHHLFSSGSHSLESNQIC